MQIMAVYLLPSLADYLSGDLPFHGVQGDGKVGDGLYFKLAKVSDVLATVERTSKKRPFQWIIAGDQFDVSDFASGEKGNISKA